MQRHETNSDSPRVYIEYTSSTTGGERLNPEERWSDRADQTTTLSVQRLYASEPKHLFFKDSIEVDPSVLECSEVYLVVVRYQTGDTFGRSLGNFHFYSVRKTEQEAIEDRFACETPVKKGDYGSYRPWDGYFERLEFVEIMKMPLHR